MSPTSNSACTSVHACMFAPRVGRGEELRRRARSPHSPTRAVPDLPCSDLAMIALFRNRGLRPLQTSNPELDEQTAGLRATLCS
eukprot:7795677-Pyramimonas_sp.AAC.1